MKLQYPIWLDVTPITVKITNGLAENGGSLVVLTVNKNCRLDESGVTYYDKEGKRVRSKSAVYFAGDVAPEYELTGSVICFTKEYVIASGKRHRNPDGSVCYIELALT